MDSLYAREFILPVSKGYFPPLGFAKLKYISVSENARYADIRLIVGITGNAPPRQESAGQVRRTWGPPTHQTVMPLWCRLNEMNLMGNLQ